MKCEIDYTEMDSLLLFLAEGDLSKLPVLKAQDRRTVLKYYYHKRLVQLNELLGKIAELEYIKSLKKR